MRTIIATLLMTLILIAGCPLLGEARGPRHVSCSACSGSGKCWPCHGGGKRLDGANCSICGGSGKCSSCDGRGEH